MKKIIFGIFFCIFPLLSTAQTIKHASKVGKAVVGKSAMSLPKGIPAEIAVGLRKDYWKTAGSIIDKLKPYSATKIKVSTTRYEEDIGLYRSLNFKTVEELRNELLAHGSSDSYRITEAYKQDLKTFLEIKRELDVFLGYQRIEPKSISLSEQMQLVKLIEEAQTALSGLSKVLGTRNPSIHYAALWLRNVYMSISPMAATILGQAQESLLEKTFHAHRKFDLNEFLLKNPDGSPLRTPYSTPTQEDIAFALKQASELPARTIAFLNDDPEILEWARDWTNKGYFGKGTRIATFNSMEKLVDWITSGVKYDVMFLDYVLEEGVSLYVVDELRATGDMETVVFLNSALEQHEVKAEDLFSHGVDGFVTSIGFRPDTGWLGVTNALHNYEVYKAKHGWVR